MSDWSKSLPDLRARAWSELVRGSGGPDTPGQRVVLATLNKTGAPETRILVLRGADAVVATVQLHTDAKSCKINQLRPDPRAALHYWNDRQQLQVRLRGTMGIATGPKTAETWADLRQTSRFSYGVKPTPGTPIPNSDAYSRIPDPGQFAVLTMHVDDIDIVHLAGDWHRRARYRRADGWQGCWLAP